MMWVIAFDQARNGKPETWVDRMGSTVKQFLQAHRYTDINAVYRKMQGYEHSELKGFHSIQEVES